MWTDRAVEPHDQRKPEVAARILAACLALAAATACGGSKPGPVRPVASSASHEVLPFIHDDYSRALAEARAKKKPIFVDAWAPWCHSCLSLRSYVLTDPSLAPIANDYVWLSIDTEKESNAPFVAKFTHEALPTLWVIRPEDEEPTLRWAGTVTAKELRDLLAAKPSELHAAHERTLAMSKQDEPACARLAATEAPKLPRGTPRADIVATGLACARGAKLEAEADVLAEIALRDASEGEGALLADDRSALFEEVVETKRARGDEAGARAVATRWAAFLEAEAAKAKTPEARAVFDAHRLGAYLALGQPERAVPMLLASERDFPGDYNPPARLAVAYLEMKRLDDASAAIDRAAKRVYGPRAMRVLSVAADVAKARGDRAGERRALEEALARTEKATLTTGQKKVRERLAKRLAAIGP